MNINNNICIYVSSPFSYKDIFDIYYQTYKKFASQSSIPLVLSTNYNAIYEDIKIISSGDINDSWVSRSIDALKLIDTKYILLMCDDIFLTAEMNDNKIYHIVDFMEKNDINFCRLQPRKKGLKIKGENFLIREYQTSPYAKNLQIGIYNKEYLLNVIGDGSLSAWDIEARWLKECLYAEKKPFKDIICVSKPIIEVVHGVEKGKLYPSTIRKLKQLGFEINSDRKILSRYWEIKKNIIGKIGIVLSPKVRYCMKKLLSKIGFIFVSEY